MKLHAWLKANDMTWQQLSFMTDITVKTLMLFDNGQLAPGARTMEKIRRITRGQVSFDIPPPAPRRAAVGIPVIRWSNSSRNIPPCGELPPDQNMVEFMKSYYGSRLREDKKRGCYLLDGVAIQTHKLYAPVIAARKNSGLGGLRYPGVANNE
jgi:hypothetical protein